jgi:glycosyltransferase involved in cell wall biosynthesis
MPETAFSFSNLESPSAGATLPQGRHLLMGWVWPKAGGHFVDVRARIGPRVFPGVHGIPRSDLAAHFQTGLKFSLAEFQVAVEFSPGPVELVLEVLTIEGRWSVFQTVGYFITPQNPPKDFAVPASRLKWLDFCRGLQRLLRESGSQPAATPARLAAALIAELPYPRDLRHPPAPLLGFVDQPAMVTCCRFGRIPAFGHLFHPTLKMRRVLGTVDLQTWQTLTHGQPSPGPAAHYHQFENARDCGFASLVDVPAQLPNPLSLRIYAELEDDSLHLCHVVRTRAHAVEEEKLAYPIQRPGFFDGILAVWNEGLAARGMVVERDAELDRALAELRAEYERRAPLYPMPPSAPLIESPRLTSAPLPRRVILATHGLSLQGAPRFLLDYGRYLAAAGVQVQVISAEDGPLRAEFAAFGATVTRLDMGAVFTAGCVADAKTAIAASSTVADWASADLVVANSFTTFWAVHAAKNANRPTILYVHESTTPATFYEQRVPPSVISLAEEAFALADAVSFTTASTRSYHLGYGRPERHRLTSGWIDVPALDRWLAGQTRDNLRQRFGLRPGELLVCNIGTVSDRKGQHTFARAVDLLWRRQPALAARTRFILLGGRDTPFDWMLADVLAELGRDNLVVHPETTDYLPYYAAADFFACSSYEESSPRVVLEAMACRVPIIASAVQGIPELVRPDLEACLLPAGDTAAWSEGLARLLSSPEIGRNLAVQARAKVEASFSAQAVLPRHLALAAEVSAGRLEPIRNR